MSRTSNDTTATKPFKGIRRHLHDGEVVIMDLPLSATSILVPGLIKIIWLAVLIFAAYHYGEIYDFLRPYLKSAFTGPDAFAALDRLWNNYEFVFSIALFGVIIAAISIIWRLFRRALGISTAAARDSILLPLTAIRDLFFFERIITNNRIVTRSGVFVKDQDDTGFEAIKATQIYKSVIGNIFDFGDLRITDRLGYSFILRQVTAPEKVAKELSDFFGRVTSHRAGEPVNITGRSRETVIDSQQQNRNLPPEGDTF
ncbi:PH domain-containing protein [Thalassospira mesophila]|uniref:YdbS-like PH domain-containing protein n=1 Tax=Thalassospira mesophila TaxID=1293891 RepID=A0A1Y2L2K3_9PROT|nr:PH domain-containing protein [Thalassospira mesophila]OSQ39706.1 hypothetical protein TMES_07005 [Thalassospira mesophila]